MQGYCPLLWAGDQCVDFSRHDGMGTAITAALSSGLLGNAYAHSDIGGYTSLHGVVRTADVLLRWMEMAAFTPVFRSHEGNRPDDNLQLDSSPELLAHCASFARVHAALVPYVHHLMNEAEALGLPAQRALFLHYPQDRATYDIQDQYLYGADLLIAPVIEEGAIERSVYLPGSEPWVHVWSGQCFDPGWHVVESPIGSPPVFFSVKSSFSQLFAGLERVRGGDI